MITAQSRQVGVQSALGQLEWPLPARLFYLPYTLLYLSTTVSNPTQSDRAYGLRVVYLVEGQVAESQWMTVDGYQWFNLPARQQASMEWTFWADCTDLVLRLELVDQATSQVAAQVQVELINPVAEPERGPMAGGLDLNALLVPVMGVAVLGMAVTPLMRRVLKRA